jgi:NitT/TauT family transport system substrate-binding protein
MTIVVQESLRGLFYAPYYAAFALGAYEKEGVEVRFAGAPGFGNAPTGLYDGSTDVAWGGPMRVNQLYAERGDCDVVCFGEAVTRDPFILVGNKPHPDFALTDLARVRVATVSEVPTPWLCLQHDLRLAGIDPAGLDRVADHCMADNMAALRAGSVDVVQLSSRWPRSCSPMGRGICGTRRRAVVRARTRPSMRGAG